MIINRYYIFILLLLILSCIQSSKIEEDISKIKVDITLERFDLALKNSTPDDLGALRHKFPFLFSNQMHDSIYVKRMKDSLQNELLIEVEKTFPDFDDETLKIEQLFKHIKYYNPLFKIPRVVTLTNDVDYRNKTLVTDSLTLISLDCFLGKEHRFYQNLPRYISANLSAEQIIPDLAEQYAWKFIHQYQRRTFLEDMIFFGKLLYFKDLMIPFESNATKIGYTEEQLAWSQANEAQIWSYFIEKELLFSPDPRLANRFLANAPFSKFYKEIDNESPGRIGQFIGWQIVKSYVENNDTPPMDVLKLDAQTLFQKSFYKPKK